MPATVAGSRLATVAYRTRLRTCPSFKCVRCLSEVHSRGDNAAIGTEATCRPDSDQSTSTLLYRLQSSRESTWPPQKSEVPVDTSEIVASIQLIQDAEIIWGAMHDAYACRTITFGH
jgi:hypothetical protein